MFAFPFRLTREDVLFNLRRKNERDAAFHDSTGKTGRSVSHIDGVFDEVVAAARVPMCGEDAVFPVMSTSYCEFLHRQTLLVCRTMYLENYNVVSVLSADFQPLQQRLQRADPQEQQQVRM